MKRPAARDDQRWLNFLHSSGGQDDLSGFLHCVFYNFTLYLRVWFFFFTGIPLNFMWIEFGYGVIIWEDDNRVDILHYKSQQPMLLNISDHCCDTQLFFSKSWWSLYGHMAYNVRDEKDVLPSKPKVSFHNWLGKVEVIIIRIIFRNAWGTSLNFTQ